MSPALKLGFVALSDAAPLWMAEHWGFYAEQGLNVELCKQPSWSTLRDKLIYGELDAAQLLSPLLLALHWGLGRPAALPMQVACWLNRGGNAVVLSNALLPAYQQGLLPKTGLRVGTVLGYSMHSLQLQAWLMRQGVDLHACTFEVVAPNRMVDALAADRLDVYCAGEPFGTLAEQAGVGQAVAHSGQFWAQWPEKVLALKAERAATLGDALPRLVQAVQAACHKLNSDAACRAEAAQVLSHPDVLNLPESALRVALLGHYPEGLGIQFGQADQGLAPDWFSPFSATVTQWSADFLDAPSHPTPDLQTNPF